MVYGPLRHTIESTKDLNQSNARIHDLFLNTTSTSPLPPNGMHVYTDVRDLAEAHLLAATEPAAGGKRFIICAGQISSQEISDILRNEIASLKDRTPEGEPGKKGLPADSYTCSSEKVKSELGLTFRSKEETFVDLAKQLLEIEAREKA